MWACECVYVCAIEQGLCYLNSSSEYYLSYLFEAASNNLFVQLYCMYNAVYLYVCVFVYVFVCILHEYRHWKCSVLFFLALELFCQVCYSFNYIIYYTYIWLQYVWRIKNVKPQCGRKVKYSRLFSLFFQLFCCCCIFCILHTIIVWMNVFRMKMYIWDIVYTIRCINALSMCKIITIKHRIWALACENMYGVCSILVFMCVSVYIIFYRKKSNAFHGTTLYIWLGSWHQNINPFWRSEGFLKEKKRKNCGGIK